MIIKNILKIPSKLVIRFSTLITIIISLLIGRFRLLFLQYLIAFIHEIFHCIGALIFKLNINQIYFLPFGFYAEIDDLYNVKWYQELIIIILGPLSFFFSLILINYLFINNYISYLLYTEISKTNILILLFNLLPIYPLDGYRILKILLELLFPEKKTLRIMNIISLIATLLLTIYAFNHYQIFIISFLIISQINLFKNIKNIYRKFLISKSSKQENKITKFHFFDDLYRPYNNLVFKNHKIYSDEKFSIMLLKNKK